MRRTYFILAALTACGSCYRLPEWKGDVKVTPLERKAVKTCGDGALTLEGTKRITREPYLQSTTTSSTIVAWGTRDGRGDVVVTEPGGDIVARASASYVGDPDLDEIKRTKQDDERLSADDMYIVAAKVADLKPTHLYCYQIFANGVAMTNPAPMSTAAAPGIAEPIRFVAVGDTGTGGAAQDAIEKRMLEVPFDFILFLGDIAYDAGTAGQLNGRFFAVYKNILRYVPAYPTIGNHERRTRKGRPYFDAFVLPEPERYYSFDWGDIHFVAIDTTKYDTNQLRWLDEDLAKNKLPWVIAYGHHPMYTNSLRGAQLPVRKAFAKIFTDHKVDLVLTGHEHQYERFLIAGVNYIVSGGGGGQLTKFYGHVKSLKQATLHHYLAFEVTRTKLSMKAIAINGKTIESLSLTKTPLNNEKVKSNGKPSPVNPVPPEKEIKPNEKLHDKPDDDKTKIHVPPPLEEPPPVDVKKDNTSAPIEVNKDTTSARR